MRADLARVSSRLAFLRDPARASLWRWAAVALVVAGVGAATTFHYAGELAATQESNARAEAQALHDREVTSRVAHLELLEQSVLSALDSLGTQLGPHAGAAIEVAQLMSSNAVTKVPAAAAVAFVDDEARTLVSGGSSPERAEFVRTLGYASREPFEKSTRVTVTTDPDLLVVERAMPGDGAPYHMAALISLDLMLESSGSGGSTSSLTAAGDPADGEQGHGEHQFALGFARVTADAHHGDPASAFGIPLSITHADFVGAAVDDSTPMVLGAGLTLSAALGLVILVLALSRSRAIVDRDRAMALSDELSVASDVARSSARRLEDVLRASPDTVAVVSNSGDISVLNRDTFLGLPLRAVGTVEQLAALATGSEQARAVLAAIAADDTTGEAQFAVEGSAGTAWYRLRRAPVDTADGSCVVSFTDITREVEEERRAREAESHLLQTQRLESVGRLAGGVAHDVNNLLAAILAGAELATSINRDADVQLELDEIVATARRGAAVTRQLLQFSRRGDDGTPTAVVELDPLVRRTETLLRRATGDGIELSLDLDAPTARVLADPTEVEQVLLNLVVNARDAVDGAGRIEVRTRIDDRDGEPVVVVEVADNGCGMDEQTAARVFEPFFTTKDAEKGTGLGLASVYGIVTRAKGTVTIDSEPGAGTTFCIALPIQATEGPAHVDAGPAAEETAEDDARLSLLVVEDDAAVLRTTRRMLERLGHRVDTARTGAEAQERCRVSRYDVLLIDVLLGGGASGPDLSRDLLAAHRGPVGVMFMSGYDRTVVEGHGVCPDTAIFIQKPFTSTDLARALSQAAQTETVGGSL